MTNHFQQIIVIINPVGARFIAPDGRDTSKKTGRNELRPYGWNRHAGLLLSGHGVPCP